MNKYFKIMLLAALAFGTVSCDKHIVGNPDPDPNPEPEPPKIEYEEVLSVNLNKVWQDDPVFNTDGYFRVNVVFPNDYYDTFPKTNNYSSVGTIRVHNYGDSKLLIGTGLGHDKESQDIKFLDLDPGDGIDEAADAHYYYLGFTSQVGTFDVRLEFTSAKQDYWCTPKFRVVIGKDSEGLWTVNMSPLEE